MHTRSLNGQQFLLKAESIEEICSESAVDNDNRSFNPDDLLPIADKPNSFNVPHILYDKDINNDNDPVVQKRRTRLYRNLAGFNLQINGTAKDGDCAFCSIARKLRATYSHKDNEVWQHLSMIII